MAGRRRRYEDDLDPETGEVRRPARRTESIAGAVAPPAEIPVLATPSERVAFIVGLMRELAWPSWPASLQFRARLAEAWGVSDSSIRSYSAEAHRVIELDPADRVDVAQDIARRCDKVAEDALNHVNEQTGLPDYGAALRAFEMKAKFLGAEPPKEVKLSGGVSLATLDELRKAVRGDDDTGGEPEG